VTVYRLWERDLRAILRPKAADLRTQFAGGAVFEQESPASVSYDSGRGAAEGEDGMKRL
jgi:hypothetical protein